MWLHVVAGGAVKRVLSLPLVLAAAVHLPSCILCLSRLQQDFMGFLHLGWESATFEDDGLCKPLAELSPLWAAVAQVRC